MTIFLKAPEDLSCLVAKDSPTLQDRNERTPLCAEFPAPNFSCRAAMVHVVGTEGMYKLMENALPKGASADKRRKVVSVCESAPNLAQQDSVSKHH